MNKDNLIKLLSECASDLEDREYRSWYNANTMLTYEEWRSVYTKELIENCYMAINELLEYDPAE